MLLNITDNVVSELKLLNFDNLPGTQGDEGELNDTMGGDDNFDGSNVIITSISTGLSHCIANSNVGVMYTWGRNDYGQVRLDKEQSDEL